jgi:uncharacterized protein YbbK (DUF523 family)
MSEQVLVSACLLGAPVRYNGNAKTCADSILKQWLEEGRVVVVCPEVAGGLGIPRPPAEIQDAAGGLRVLRGEAAVVTNQGVDVTAQFVAGAERAAELARELGIRVAVLKEGSPSCGSGSVSDGSFQGVRVPGSGVTAAALKAAGVQVFSESQLQEAARALA